MGYVRPWRILGPPGLYCEGAVLYGGQSVNNGLGKEIRKAFNDV